MINIRPINGSEQGSGMIDIIIAVVLLGIAFVGMLAGFTHASDGARENRERIQATMLMQETMETIKRYDGMAVNDFDLSALTPDGAVKLVMDKNTVEYTVTPDTKVKYGVIAKAEKVNSMEKLLAVTVKVGWKENGSTRLLQMLEYIYLK